MTINVTIEIKSEPDARQWMSDMESTNTETTNEIAETAQILKDIGIASTGDIIDQLVNAGETLLSGVSDVLDSMTGVVTAVGGVLDSAANLVDSATGFVKTLGGIFGL